MTIEEAVNELDELTMYVEHAFTEEHKSKSFEALQMAIVALEKQIPKTPIDKIMYKECPICGSVDLGKYCMECGQAIKWE